VFDEIAPAIRTVSSPFLIEGVKKEKPRMAPQAGEHTWEILRSLGYQDTEIAALLNRGAATAYQPKAAVKD
ncbi:MAG TPA: hypothetical protein VJA94_10385, partial [Candidatus Angelobacter sp.]